MDLPSPRYWTRSLATDVGWAYDCCPSFIEGIQGYLYGRNIPHSEKTHFGVFASQKFSPKNRQIRPFQPATESLLAEALRAWVHSGATFGLTASNRPSKPEWFWSMLPSQSNVLEILKDRSILGVFP